MITQEDLEKVDEVNEAVFDNNARLGGAAHSLLENMGNSSKLLSPNVSGINCHNTSQLSPMVRASRSRKNNISQDMNDLSAIYQQN